MPDHTTIDTAGEVPVVVGNVQLPNDFAEKITAWLIGARPSLDAGRYEEMGRNLDELLRETYHPFRDAHYEDCPAERLCMRGDCNCLEVAAEQGKALQIEREEFRAAAVMYAAQVAELKACIDSVRAVCDAGEWQATRWEQPFPVPSWVTDIRAAVAGVSETPEAARG